LHCLVGRSDSRSQPHCALLEWARSITKLGKNRGSRSYEGDKPGNSNYIVLETHVNEPIISMAKLLGNIRDKSYLYSR